MDSKKRNWDVCQFARLLSHNTQLHLPFRLNGLFIRTLFHHTHGFIRGRDNLPFLTRIFEGVGLRFGVGYKIEKRK